VALVIRKPQQRDLEPLGRLGAMLIRTHYTFDAQRFLEPQPGIERGYGAFLSNIVDSPDSCVFVAELEGALAGYVFAALEPMSWYELRGPAGFIHDVIVDERARGRGIGTQLMEKAMQWLRERGAPRVILWTAWKNERAHALFRRIGFRETMIEMTKEL
jgi:GNAT superfamily N-acetyltransferase